MMNIVLYLLILWITFTFWCIRKPKEIRKCKDCKYFVEVSSGCTLKYMNQLGTNDYKICNYTDNEFKRISIQTDKLRNT